MLKKIGDRFDDKNLDKAYVRIKDSSFPTPFPGGVEFSAPVRGVWNIVHVGMLMPEAHEVFVCGGCCLRGVVLTAAEMNATDRFSTVTVEEKNLFDGTLEDLIVDGVTDCIAKLPDKPKVIQVYTNCIHHFAGIDFDNVYERLEKKNPDRKFMRCFMNPIMRKSGLAPEPLMRKQLFSLLEKPTEKDEKLFAVIGNDYPINEGSELREIVNAAGYKYIEIQDCNTYEEYQEIAKASTFLTTYLPAVPAGESCAMRLGGKHIYKPIAFDYDEIGETLDAIADEICAPHIDHESKIAECEKLLSDAKDIIKEMPMAIDYTFAPRPLSLAYFLLTHGFKVECVFADSFSKEEEKAYDALCEEYPDLLIYATSRYEMRYVREDEKDKYLALGQKAAYFMNTDHFVNFVIGSGHFGYEAIRALAMEMIDAYKNKKNADEIISVKGWGCEEECSRLQV